MKKLLLTLFLLGIVGMVAYGAYLYLMAPERVYCTRLVQLCELKGQEPIDTCNEVLSSIAEKEREAVREAATCAVESETCTETAGCLVGAGAALGLRELGKLAPLLGDAPSLVDDFMKGVKKGAGKLLE